MIGTFLIPFTDFSDGATAGVLGGCAVLGLVLLFWGRRLGPFLMMAGAGVAGYFLGDLAAAPLGVNPLAARISAAITAALLAYVLNRLIWATLAAGICGLVAMYIILLRMGTDLRRVATEGLPANSITNYADTFINGFMRPLIETLWQQNAPLVVLVGGLAVAIPLVLMLLRPRFLAIVTSSLLGAGLLVSSVLILVTWGMPSSQPVLQQYWYVVGGVKGALFVSGMIVQYRNAGKKPPPEEKPKEPAKAPAK